MRVKVDEDSKNSWPYRVFSAGALLLFLATLVPVLRTRLGMAELYHFVLPSAVVVGLILLGERVCGWEQGNDSKQYLGR